VVISFIEKFLKNVFVDSIMRKFVFLLGMLFFFGLTSGIPVTEISYFYSVTCSHCEAVAEDGILERVSVMEGVVLEKYETTSPVYRERYLEYLERFDVERGGIPFLVVEQGDEAAYLMGDSPIINDLEDLVLNFEGMDFDDGDLDNEGLTLTIVIVAAFIDSVNPCAFGVLLFLMAVLLKIGSAKRAFRSGMIYVAVIFFVYLAAGFGIMRFAGDFLILDNVKIFVGTILLIGAGLELKDFFFEGKGFSLAIPKSTKPMLEKYARRGTFVSLVILGALVALVELPCTGGIYLAILSLIADSGAKGVFYLVLYNMIFVLPLIFISMGVYTSARVEGVNDWVQRNKRFMRLGAGIVMIGLGLNLLGVI
jgi:cytochrome c biogenesis protein CcdA